MTNNRGFTLIELLVTMVIVAILAAVAVPSYLDSVRKGRRAEGRSAALLAAQAQERFFTSNNRYTTDLTVAGYKAYSGSDLAHSAYTLTVAAGGSGSINTSFVVSAAPVASDAKCGTLVLDSYGNKTVSGGTGTPADCW